MRSPTSAQIPTTGWHSTITVEAFVVPICGAANPDTKGLLHPLLRRCEFSVLANPHAGAQGAQSMHGSERQAFHRAQLAQFTPDRWLATVGHPLPVLARRYQAMRCSYFVFSLPAVQVAGGYSIRGTAWGKPSPRPSSFSQPHGSPCVLHSRQSSATSGLRTQGGA